MWDLVRPRLVVVRSGTEVAVQVRAVVLTIALACATLAAHAAAGGGLPGLAGLAAVILLSGAFAATFSRLAGGFTAIVVFAALAQLLLHGVTSLTSTHAHSALLPDGPMLIAHMIAAICMAVVVQRGEAIAMALVTIVTALLGVRVTVSAPSFTLPTLFDADAQVWHPEHIRACLSLRGPPALPALSY